MTPAHILIVEDNELMIAQTQKLFERAGYIVDVARNGMDAMEKLMSGDKYDLLVTDLTMPVLSGQELIEAVRRNQYGDLKIMVLTASTGEATITETFALGADDCITKPFNPKDLLYRVQKLLASGR